MEIRVFPETCLAKSQVYKFIEQLETEEKIDILRVIDALSRENKLVPYVKRWRGRVFEVYFKRDNRLFFCVIDKVLYLLYACKKQKNKTENRDSKQIVKRAKELSKLLGKKIL